MTDTIPVVECTTRERLWQEYYRSVNELAGSASTLVASGTHSEFTGKMKAIRNDWEACQTARASWETHIREHCCDAVVSE
jgi:hypothetical protein